MSILQSIRAVTQRAVHLLLRVAAGAVIVLALLVGVARLVLPEAVEFKEDIRTAVEVTTGFKVDFEFISAGVSVYGPELRLVKTTISWPDDTEIATVEELAVSLDVVEWLKTRRLLPGRIYIDGTSIDIKVAESGELILQGRPWRDYVRADNRTDLDDIPDMRLQLGDIRFSFRNLQRNGPRIAGVLQSFNAVLEDGIITVAANADPGSEYGKTLDIEATLPLPLLLPDQEVAASINWELRLSADDFRLYKWLDIAEIKELPVVDSEGSAELALRLQGNVPQQMVAELDLEALQLAQPGGEPVLFDELSGRLQWNKLEQGWEAVGENLQIDRLSRRWPESSFRLLYLARPAGSRQQLSATASFLRLEDIQPFLHAIAPDQLRESGFLGAAVGDLQELNLELRLLEGKAESFRFASIFERVGYSSGQQGIELGGFSGRVEADDGGGNLELRTRDGRFGFEKLFRDVLDISSLDGLAIWRSGPEGHRLLADGISLTTPEGGGNASLELSVDTDFANPEVDLTADAHFDDVAAVWRYLPRVIPAKVLSWLDGALIGGQVPHADFRLQGALGEFPYDHDEGLFVIGVDFVDGILNIAPDWPMIENASGRLVFDGVSMYSSDNAFVLSGMALNDIDARMDDMRTGLLKFAGSNDLQVENLLQFLQESPVSDKLGPVFADVEAFGRGRVSLRLDLPIKSLPDWQLEGSLVLNDVEAGLRDIQQKFTNLQGIASIRNTRVSADGVAANLLGQPVIVDVEPVKDESSAYSHRAFVQGRLPLADIQAALNLPQINALAGNVELSAQAMFPGGKGGREPFSLFLRSDLQGLSSELPYPLGKTADELDSLQLEARFPERGTINIFGSLNRGLSWALEVTSEAERWRLGRGTIVRARQIPSLPEEPLLTLSGAIDSADLAAWTGLMAADRRGFAAAGRSAGSLAGWQSMFRRADLQIGELYALGHRFVDVDVAVDFGETAWLIDLAGPWAAGTMVVPYDFDGSTPLMIDMERLLLIEPLANGDETDDSQLDPRTLPAIRGSISDFALGNLRLGALDADIVRVSDGLRSNSLTTVAGSFGTDISYDWLVVDNAQRSRLHLKLRSKDVGDTLSKLGYSPLIEAKQGSVTADLLWEGGPGMGAVYSSTGTIDLFIKDGTVTEVDAGGGRILGLLSITTLPRRLSLDFKDMTEDGLSFDTINGTFRMDFGNAWTCNLGLEGNVADMGIVGRTGIRAEDYDQVAAVRPHVSNLAPVAGAFLAGPTVGVATLLITQLLKKPLSGIGESYYTMSGDWADPEFAKVDQSDLDTRPFSDCERELPQLSTEEIKALEELIVQANKPQVDVDEFAAEEADDSP